MGCLVQNSNNNEDNRILYHYCSFNTFLEILRNNSIRLYDATKSNDGDEIVVAINKLNKTSIKEISTDFFSKNQYEISNYFIFCLSEWRDSLHMWNMYADNGKGVAIGFKKSTFEKLKNDNNKIINFKAVQYKTSTQIDEFFQKFKNSLIDKYGEIFVNQIPFMKSKFFDCEKEWRVSFMQTFNTNDLLNLYLNNKQIPIQYDLKNDALFCEIPIDKSWIEEILIGPACKYSKKDILNFLYLFRYANEVNIMNDAIEKSSGNLIIKK